MKHILYITAILFSCLQAFAQTYNYDNLNRLIKVVYGNGTTVTYSYDELGNRLSKKVTGSTGSTFTINVDITPEGSGSVTGGGTYTYGSTVELNAIANEGYRFLKWTDEVTDNPRTITVSQNMTYTAQFVVDSNIPGDVNGDGTVTAVDITALYNYLLNSDTSNLINGDVNGDGHISAVDITVLYNYLLNGTPINNEEIVLERKYLVHHSYRDWYGGYYCYSNIALIFDNNACFNVGYYNTYYFNNQYVSESYSGVHFLYRSDIQSVGIDNANFDWNISPLVLDEWVQEKLIVSLDGHVKYYMNGNYMGEKTFDIGSDLNNATTVSIDVEPYGWWTGHYQYMDDFKIVTPATTISDNFNDGVLNPEIWQTPVNPDGVREEEGIVKLEQLRTDQDFHLRSVPITLRQRQ